MTVLSTLHDSQTVLYCLLKTIFLHMRNIQMNVVFELIMCLSMRDFRMIILTVPGP